MKKRAVLLALLAFVIATVAGCQKDDDNNSSSGEKEFELLAGTFSVYDESPNAFGHAGDHLSSQNELDFFVGNSFFNQNWVMFGASTTARDGLGPTFNARSCSGCHFKDGRGRLPDYFGETTSGFLVRLSVPGEGDDGSPLPEPIYGDQFQNQSIQDSVPYEGSVRISFETVTGQYPDGTAYSLRKPVCSFEGLAFGPMDPNTLTSIRVANQMIGMGLLDAIPEADLLAYVDETDADGDGVSGRPNYVWNIAENTQTLGRFGWKANMPDVLQQVAGAFHGDIGITSYLFPSNNCPDPQNSCQGAALDSLGPEIDDDDLQKVVLYSSTLAVPVRRNYKDDDVVAGRKLFKKAGCISCHVETFTTGTHPTIPELSNIEIHPYTDLLLHDMGEGLSDNRPDYLATGLEWRTPPLWGVGLIEVVNGHSTFLHDGRARNLEEAILWHGGEAQNAKDYFMQLNATKRSQIIAFLNSL
ncbi:MAG: thiol oxidoreductase [Crocinitomicaceae bacterium]|nr:thiol oxidoreductase [Crocinitomicaceae bacterium]